jgi:hypothetical protein
MVEAYAAHAALGEQWDYEPWQPEAFGVTLGTR